MAAFWFLTAAMAAAAVAFALVPLLRARAPRGPSATEANLEVLRAHRREIEADIAAGTLPAEAHEEALAELVGRAADDLGNPEPAPAAAPSRKPWPVAGAVAAAVPALAFGVYLAVGNPGALNPLHFADTEAQRDPAQVVAMVESLAQKMRDRPDDATGWQLLARSLASLGRFRESADAFAHLAKLVPGDAQVLADYADALGMAQGETLRGKPAELIEQALAIDPAHPKALALAASAAGERGDYAAAVRHWEALAATLPAGSPDAQQVARIVAEVRAEAAQAGKPVPGGGAPAPPAVAAGQAVTGSVSIAPEVAAKLSGQETVFIFARADGGPRLPLAVIRAKASELPMRFRLDDSLAMAPGMTISSVESLRVEARVSRSGDATPRSGDFVGASAVVKPGARDVDVRVDRVVP